MQERQCSPGKVITPGGPGQTFSIRSHFARENNFFVAEVFITCMASMSLNSSQLLTLPVPYMRNIKTGFFYNCKFFFFHFRPPFVSVLPMPVSGSDTWSISTIRMGTMRITQVPLQAGSERTGKLKAPLHLFSHLGQIFSWCKWA